MNWETVCVDRSTVRRLWTVGAPRNAVPVPGISAIAVTGFPPRSSSAGPVSVSPEDSPEALSLTRASPVVSVADVRNQAADDPSVGGVTGRTTLAKSFDDERPEGGSTARTGV